MMSPRQRLLTVLRGGIPDCVPVSPDFSNMIPCRLTGKPFWDLYLYNDPPPWEAYLTCAKRFGIDVLMDSYFPYQPPGGPAAAGPALETFIVLRTPEMIVTQQSWKENGLRRWRPRVDVYYIADSPTLGLDPAKLKLPPVPVRYEPLEREVRPVDCGPAGLQRIKDLLGEQGLVGVWGGTSTSALGSPEAIYDYYDYPERHEQWAQEQVESAEAYFQRIMAAPVKPDFLCIGGSGSLVYQTPEIFRQLALPAVKRIIELATAAGMPTHVHSCGPETELVKILAEETTLTVIDPLEIPPMGDCHLADLKRRYGDKLTLKGNLHTTDVMLRGTPAAVAAASRQAIDDAAAGGRFILSTGDQCGRDTPDENLQVMIETARSYGRYAVSG